MRARSVGRVIAALTLLLSTLALTLAVTTQPAAAATAAVDLWAPATTNLSLKNSAQSATPNHILAMAVVRHDPGTKVSAVKFDLVHADFSHCPAASVVCSGSYVGDDGWSQSNSDLSLKVRELPGQASSSTSTNSNYSQVWVEITPPDFSSFQNDGADGTVCGLEGSTRACENTAAFSFRLDDGTTTTPIKTMTYWSVAAVDAVFNEDYPTATDSESTKEATVVAGQPGAVKIDFTCDDKDTGFDTVCESARVRFRRLGDNVAVNPGPSSDATGNLTCANRASGPACETNTDNGNNVFGNFKGGDNTQQTYTFRAPRSRGTYVIEASFCNDDGRCPHGTVPSGYSEAAGTTWQTLGSFYVNDAAPTVAFGAATQTGGSTVGVNPTTGALHPNTGTTITYNVSPSADTQVVDWNLDQNGTNGINSSGYEIRKYGTMSYASSAGTPSLAADVTAQSRSLSSYAEGADCGAAVRVYDSGASVASDPTALSGTAARSCTTNLLPSATAQSGVAVQRGTATPIALAAADADRWTAGANGGDEAPTVNITQPAAGTVTCGAFTPSTPTAGSFACSYSVPPNTATGSYSYSYTVTDSHLGTSAPVTVTGSIQNTAPTATGDDHSVVRGSSGTFNLTGTDAVNGDTLDGTVPDSGYAVVSDSAMPVGSTTSCTAAGACEVAIAPDTATGDYSFTWHVADNAATSTTATETITVTNTAPTATALTVNDVQRGRPAAESSFDLAADDADGDTLTYSVASTAGLPAGSSVSCSAAGSCTVAVPSDSPVGDYPFTFTASDGTDDSAPGTVTVGVGNTDPVANPVGVLHTTVGAALPIVLDGTDFNGDQLDYIAPVSGPAKGSVTGTGGTRTYTASNGAGGADSFTYTASDNEGATSAPGTVSIAIDNSAPAAAADTVSAPRQVATDFTLEGSDPNGDALTFAVQSNVSKGVLACAADGACTYTAGPGQTGDDEFTFVTNDGVANSDPATVTIHITNTAPTATAGVYGVTKGIAKSFTLAGTDVNGDSLSFAVVDQPDLGSVSCTGPNGATCSYTATPATGTDSLTFTATDSFGSTSAPATVTFGISLPKVSVGDAQILEPDGPNQGVFVPLTLSAPLTTDITVRYYTVDGTATGTGPNADYLAFGTPTVPRTITLAAGKTWTPISPPIKADSVTEADETFQVKILSVTAADSSIIGVRDDTATVTIVDSYRASSDPLMMVQEASLYEGDSQTGTKGQFVIQFTKHVTSTFTLSYTTVPGTASESKTFQAGKDYKGPITGTLTITPSSALMQVIDVPLWGDTDLEDDETVLLQVLLPDGVAVIQKDAQGTITIVNDD